MGNRERVVKGGSIWRGKIFAILTVNIVNVCGALLLPYTYLSTIIFIFHTFASFSLLPHLNQCIELITYKVRLSARVFSPEARGNKYLMREVIYISYAFLLLIRQLLLQSASSYSIKGCNSTSGAAPHRCSYDISNETFDNPMTPSNYMSLLITSISNLHKATPPSPPYHTLQSIIFRGPQLIEDFL